MVVGAYRIGYSDRNDLLYLCVYLFIAPQHIRLVDSKRYIVGDCELVGGVDSAGELWDGTAVCLGVAESDSCTQTTESLRQHV